MSLFKHSFEGPVSSPKLLLGSSKMASEAIGSQKGKKMPEVEAEVAVLPKLARQAVVQHQPL